MSMLLKQSSRYWATCPASRSLARFSTSHGWREELYPSKRIDYESKYLEKLQKRATEQGISVEQLKARLKDQEMAKRKESLAKPLPYQAPKAPEPTSAAGPQQSSSTTTAPSASSSPISRKDSSPVKPLSNILNLEKLVQTPHTAHQVELLWRAYHGSRSGGTGRGYLCAAIPLETYEKMASVAAKYPSFVIPVPREAPEGSEDQRAYEFYFVEWAFHGSPPEPAASVELFTKPKPSTNPQTSTILFTPLQEYKLRNSFATPYLALTNYTDLARSHDVVLLRGEITPSSSGAAATPSGDGRYMLNQQDAQLLAMAIQKFYLWTDEQAESAKLLRTFHENPTEFKWEDLLKHADFSA
ncbi:ATP11 domain-containing protein [Phanerochaete sordida]|uniref:ATP11 domain-containing protein n=1 Tax=Phanerochaete sordida TaxID=48140 RepID=A0A9P3G4C5_9APHY|nr:ATP11 domain-containing protein [Phanerochaete sordida]